MRRVYIVRMLRLFLSSCVLSIFALGVTLWFIGREVWVVKVFTNGPHDFLGHARYLVYAFVHTHFVVQFLAFVALVASIYIAHTIARVVQMQIADGSKPRVA